MNMLPDDCVAGLQEDADCGQWHLLEYWPAVVIHALAVLILRSWFWHRDMLKVQSRRWKNAASFSDLLFAMFCLAIQTWVFVRRREQRTLVDLLHLCHIEMLFTILCLIWPGGVIGEKFFLWVVLPHAFTAVGPLLVPDKSGWTSDTISFFGHIEVNTYEFLFYLHHVTIALAPWYICFFGRGKGLIADISLKLYLRNLVLSLLVSQFCCYPLVAYATGKNVGYVLCPAPGLRPLFDQVLDPLGIKFYAWYYCWEIGLILVFTVYSLLICVATKATFGTTPATTNDESKKMKTL